MRKFIDDMKGNYGAYGLVAMFVFVVLIMMFATKARAADPKWTGCGVGVQGGMITADVADNSQFGGVHALCDIKAGNLVFGAFTEYNLLRGDAKDMGVDAEIGLGGRGGFLLTPAVLLYGHAAKSWLDIAGGGTVDGVKYGGGIDLKLPDAPMFLGFRYDQGRYEDAGQSLTTHSVSARLTFKFQETEKPLQDLVPAEEKPAPQAKPAAKAKKIAP